MDSARGATLTLQDLLNHDEFGLSLLTGDAHRPVAGAHALEEIADPLQWVPAGWIMLTTGVRLRGKPPEQRRLIADLAEGGVSALGFGVGIAFENVPPAMVREARERDFPLFTVPLLTPFREIVRRVDTALLTSDLQTLRRAFSMHGYLLDALGTATPETELVRRLAEVLSCDAALFRGDGRPVAATRPGQAAGWWEQLRATAAFAQGRELLDHASLMAAPVPADDGGRGWIVVANHDGGMGLPVAHRIVASAVPIVRALGSARSLAAAEEHVMRADLLHEILEPSPRAETSPGAPPGLRERGLLLGLDLDRPSRVALVVGRPPVAGRLATPDADREALTRALAAALTRAHVPHLIGPHGPRVAIVVQGDPDLEAILEDLGDVGVQVACGVGRAVEPSGDLPLSLRDASVALEQSRARRGPRIMRYDDLDLMSWLILEVGEDAVRSKAEAVLAPLADRPELHETLVEYLRQSMDVPATARRLHVHQNSMRHRLGRIEQLLGRSLRSAPDLAAIHVALLITSAVGTPPSASSPSRDSV